MAKWLCAKNWSDLQNANFFIRPYPNPKWLKFLTTSKTKVKLLFCEWILKQTIQNILQNFWMVCYFNTCITDFKIYYVVYRIYTNVVSLMYCFYWALYCCRDKHKNKKVLPLLLFTDLGKYFFKVLERPLKDRRRSNKKLAFQSYFVTHDFSTEL